MSNRSRIGILVAACGVALTLLVAGRVLAFQEHHPEWPPESVVEIEVGTYWENLSNRYIAISLGTRGWIKPWPVRNSSTQYDVAGRWSIITAAGDPGTDIDNNQQLIFLGGLGLTSLPAPCPCGNFGYFKVKIEDGYV